MADFRAELRAVLDTDRSRLAAAATDDGALAELVERITYRLQVEAGLPVDPVGPRAHMAMTALPGIRDVLLDLEPHFATHVASSLHGLLTRQPWKDGLGWEAERLVLGALWLDLQTFAREAGEPDAEARDLRSAETKGDERVVAELRELEEIRGQREAYARIARELEELGPVTPAAAPAADGADMAWI